MSYTRGPHALFPTLPVPPRPVLVSSRKVVAQTGRYELDATTGGNAAMLSVTQRVLLIVASRPVPRTIIDDSTMAAHRDALIADMAVMGTDIALTSVDVENPREGVVTVAVHYKNLSTGLDETVQA